MSNDDVNHEDEECVGMEGLAPVDQEESESRDQSQDVEHGRDDRDETHEDGDAEEEARNPRGARDPGQPTQAEREEHERTHIPFRPWCEACVKGKSKRKPSRRIAGEFADDQCCRIRMDYAYLTEEVENESGEHGEAEAARAGSTLTMLVVQESQFRNV